MGSQDPFLFLKARGVPKSCQQSPSDPHDRRQTALLVNDDSSTLSTKAPKTVEKGDRTRERADGSVRDKPPTPPAMDPAGRCPALGPAGDRALWEVRPGLAVTGGARSCGHGSKATKRTSACGLGSKPETDSQRPRSEPQPTPTQESGSTAPPSKCIRLGRGHPDHTRTRHVPPAFTLSPGVRKGRTASDMTKHRATTGARAQNRAGRRPLSPPSLTRMAEPAPPLPHPPELSMSGPNSTSLWGRANVFSSQRPSEPTGPPAPRRASQPVLGSLRPTRPQGRPSGLRGRANDSGHAARVTAPWKAIHPSSPASSSTNWKQLIQVASRVTSANHQTRLVTGRGRDPATPSPSTGTTGRSLELKPRCTGSLCPSLEPGEGRAVSCPPRASRAVPEVTRPATPARSAAACLTNLYCPGQFP